MFWKGKSGVCTSRGMVGVGRTILLRITGTTFTNGLSRVESSVPFALVPKPAPRFHYYVCGRERVVHRHIELTRNGTPDTGSSNGVVRMVDSTYRSYPVSDCAIARGYRGYLNGTYVGTYGFKTVRTKHLHSRVSPRGYGRYKHYTRTYPCGTVTRLGEPYGFSYPMGTVACGRCNVSIVSRDGYVEYNGYVRDYPFKTVKSGACVMSMVSTVGSRGGRMCTVITPTTRKRFNTGVAVGD